jgi:TRAP-type C4-dicarboxylate transport system permease small subunit
MSQIINRLAVVTRMLAGICLGIMALMIGTLIFGRYLSLSVPWADEIARILFVWAALLGASSGTHKRLHFSVSFFTSYLKDTTRKKMDLVLSLMIIAFMILIFFVGLDSLKVARIQIFPGLKVSKLWMSMPILIFATLVSIFTLEHIRKNNMIKQK